MKIILILLYHSVNIKEMNRGCLVSTVHFILPDGQLLVALGFTIGRVKPSTCPSQIKTYVSMLDGRYQN